MITESRLPDTLLVPESRLRYRMYLKVTDFNFAMLTLGCFEDQDAARLIGMKTHKTIKSARAGFPISDELMAMTMAVFKLNADRLEAKGIEVSYDTFFEERARDERHDAEQKQAA